MSRNISLASDLCSVGILATLSPAMAFTGQAFAKDATISMKQASNIALKVRPGKISDKELEREKGGSGLRYSFDIKGSDATYEVGVDAKTGKILENAPEGKKAD